LHGAGGGDTLCEDCRVNRLVAKQVREEEAVRADKQGLVDVGSALGPGSHSGRMQLHVVWAAVINALKDKEPPGDIVILDELRIGELPSRWPPREGWFVGRRTANWEEAVDRLGLPAWDTKRGLRVGGGVADTFSIDAYPLYVGRNGVLYCGPARATPNGTFAEWRSSYRYSTDIDGAWTAKWMPYGTYYPRQEVADALVNLVAIHGLSPQT
jgi:hypothetical protein